MDTVQHLLLVFCAWNSKKLYLFYRLGDVKFVYQFLQKLLGVDRFEITLMFLSSVEKQGILAIFIRACCFRISGSNKRLNIG